MHGSRLRTQLMFALVVAVFATIAGAAPTIQVAPTLCPGGTGVATLSPPPGGGSWSSITWTITNGRIVSGQGTPTLNFWNNSLATITIGASATDSNGVASSADPVNVAVNQTTAPNIDTKGSVCINGTNTATVLNASSYPNPIVWNVTNGTIVANRGASIDYQAGSSGDVLVNAQSTDANGCHVESQWSVHIVPPPSADITLTPGTCAGIYNASVPDAGPNPIYDWSISNGVFTNTPGMRMVSFTPTGSAPVTLTVNVTEYFRGCTTTGTWTGTLPSSNGPQVTVDQQTACSNAVVHASVAGPYPGLTWSVVNGYIFSSDAQSASFYAYGPKTQIIASFPDGAGCTRYGGAEVLVQNGGVAAPVISTSVESTCQYSNVTASVAPPASGSWSYLNWTITGGKFRAMTYPYTDTTYSSDPNPSFYADGTGPVTLSVHGYTNTGCNSPEGTKTLQLRAASAPTITTSAAAVCPYSNATASVAPPAEGTWQYVSWSITGGMFRNNSYPYGGDTTYANGENVTFYANGNGPVTLHAFAYDSFGCNSPEATKTVNIRTVAAPAINVASPSICSYTDSTASVAPPAEGSWQYVSWSITGGSFRGPYPGSTQSYANGENVTFYADGSGPVTLHAFAYDSLGCNSPEATATVNLRTIAAPAINVAAPAVCAFSDSTASIAPPAVGSWTYVSWSISGGSFRGPYPGSTQSYANGETVTFFADGSGPVTLHAFGYDSLGCNSPEGTATVNLRTIPAPVINTSVEEMCAYTSATASIAPPASGSWGYVGWSITGGHFGYLGSQTTATGETVDFYSDGSGPVTLTVNAFDSFGCNSPLATKTVNLRTIAAPAIHFSVAAVCPGGSATATVDPPAGGGSWMSVYWSVANGNGGFNNGTTFNFSAGQSGTADVTVFVIDDHGCNASATVSLPIDVPAATITAGGPTTFCPGGSVTLTANSGASYLWSNGATTQSITVNAAGNYSVEVTNATGCSAQSTATTVTVRNVTPATISPAEPVQFCQGGSATLTASAGASYRWSTGATTQSIVVTSSADYWVDVTDANGCVSRAHAAAVATGPSKPGITPSGATTFCAGGSVTLFATGASQGSVLWSNGATSTSIVVAQSGSYSVTVTDSNGCSATSDPTVVTVNTPQVPMVFVDRTYLCANQTATMSAQPGTQYHWSTGATTQNITVSNGGTYWVDVTDAHGCTARSANVVIQKSTLAVNATPAYSPGFTNYVCPGQPATYTANVSGGDGPYTYQWLNSDFTVIAGATNPTFTTSTWQRMFQVRVTDSHGCSIVSNFTAESYPANSTIAIGNTGSTTFCAGGSVTLTAQWGGTTGTRTYLWSTGATTSSIIVTTPGTFGLTMTDGYGCSYNATPVTVVVNPRPDTTVTAPDHICMLDTVTASVPDAGTGATYNWFVTGATILSGQGTRSITFRDDGNGHATLTPSVNVTSAAGCFASGSKAVTQTVPRNTGITASSFVCENRVGNTATVGDFGPGFTYAWTLTNGTITSGAGTPTVTWTAGAAGTNAVLQVTVRDSFGCTYGTGQRTWLIDAGSKPVITASGPKTFCLGGSVTLTAPTTHANLVWSTGATTQSIVVTTSGQYTVTGRDLNGCVVTSDPVFVTVNNPPAATISASGPTTFCAGGSVTLTANLAASYLWSNGATTRSIVATSSGAYSVRVTDANGCSTTSSATTVIVNPLPTPTITAGGPTTFCAGGSVTLTASAASSYLWSNGATTQSITVNASGNYSVTVTDANGCSATSAATSVTADPVVDKPTVTSTSTSICPGGSVTMTAHATGGSGAYSYQWFHFGGAPISGATSQTYVASPASNDYYFVAVTDSLGCAATEHSDAVIVTVNAAPDATMTAPAAICEGSNGSASVPDAGAGATYNWTISGGVIDYTMANGAAAFFHANSGATSVTLNVTVTTAAGCSTASAQKTVTVNALPSTAISASGPTTFCAGGSVTLTAPAAASYSWSNGATTQSITVNASGSYSVSVTNANGCSATSAATSVTVNPLPTPTITPGGPTTFCAGGSVTLTASAASSYLWSNGATTQSINVTSSGNYSVTVTNANGCSATSAATSVTVNPLPTPTISAGGPTTFCAGGSVTLTASASSSYLWSNGATTQSINVNASGNYSVTVTDANGCSATSSATSVTVNPLPTPTISAGGPTTFCAGGSVTLTASASSSYLWSNGATTQSITVNASGNYSVSVTDANGCSATSPATSVTVNPLPTPTISAGGPTTFCAGGSVTLTASAASSYLWSNGATTQSITVNASGNYTVTVTNANGCSATSSATSVTVNPLPTPTITAGGPTTFCAGGSVTLTASASSSYLWSNGATTQSIVVNASGNYSVTVTNANGCSATSSATSVTVNPLPTPTITAGGPTTFCAGGSVTLTASAASSYLWSNGATTQSIVVNASGNYSVTVTNANGCSATSSSTSVTVNPLPTPTITAGGPTTFCAGGSVTLTASAASSYLWSNGATTQSINVTSSGNYSVTVTNANGCNATSAATTVTVNAKPATPAITPSGPTTFCAGGSVTLTAPAGFTYSWSTGATSQSIVVNASGNYTVTVTNANGCSTTSAATTVTVNANPATPSITAGGPTTFCAGGSVTLSAPAGFTYTWSTGATTQSINATASANYTVTVTNANGCSATSAPTAVTVNPATAITSQPSPASQTVAHNVQATITVGATGTGTLTYQWFQGAAGNTSTPVGTNSNQLKIAQSKRATYTYWVRVTGSCGTANSTTATVIVN